MTTVNQAETKEQMQQRLTELNAEIGAYPGPITGCDAQFNYLLEERARLSAELKQLEDTSGEKRK